MNGVTIKITDGGGSNAWTGGRPGMSYRTSRAVGWLMGIGNGRWIARYRNRASRPMKLPAAKTYALEMTKGIRPAIVLQEPVAHLNKITAAVIGANEKWRAPIEPDLLAYIREVETGVPPSPEGPRHDLRSQA